MPTAAVNVERVRFIPAARVRTSSLTAASAVAAGVVLAACGGGTAANPSGSSTPSGTSASSTSAAPGSRSAAPSSPAPSSAPAPSASLKVGATLSGAQLAGQMTAAEVAAKSVHVTQVSTGGQPVQVDLAFTGNDSRDIDLKDGTTGGMRLINGDYWMYSSDATDGKPWMSVLKSDKSQAATSVRAALVTGAAGYATSDPQITFDQGKATYLGLDGTGSHYRVVVPAFPVYQLLAGDAGVSEKTTLTGKTVTYDVWLGAQNRPAKVVLDASAFQALDTGGDTGPAPGMTVTYSNWGKPVSITPPPPAQVATVDQRMGSIGGGSPADSGAAASPAA